MMTDAGMTELRTPPTVVVETAVRKIIASQQAGPVDLLTQAAERVRPILADTTKPIKERVRILWAAVKWSGDLGASDIVHDVFKELAIETGLISHRALHVIAWAQRGWNPFEDGPLK
jgi:hypothetical protein